jgi:hypothetical protein
MSQTTSETSQATAPNHSARRIDRLAAGLGARTYLEIGVARGVTFRDVRIAERTGVDPGFKVAAHRLAGPGIDLVETTSDAFFAGTTPERVWDIVFIDGLHEFEQTYRDLCNVLLHSHPRTAILVDDTWPSDVYSSVREQERALAVRRSQIGDERRIWHGDVFKVVFAIHEFHTGLDYVTITQGGNPQTLVWRASDTREPLGWTFEQISRLTYFDLLDHQEVLRPSGEDEAIERCLASIGARQVSGSTR